MKIVNKKIQAIIFCGLDGSGKTTQANKILDYLTNKKIKSKYVWFRYPNRLSIPFAIFLRFLGISAYPIPETRKKAGIKNLFGHSTLQKIWKKILLMDFKFVSSYKVFQPIKSENLIILDRFVIDTIVELTISFGENSISKSISIDFLNLIPKNSKIFFLDIDPLISYQRNHEEAVEVLKLKKSLYLELFKSIDVNVIDGNKPIDVIHNTIKEKLNIF